MATTTMATVDSILKEVYEGQLRDQLQSDTVTLKRIESSSEGVTHEVGGKYVTFPIRTKRNQGVGARIENEALPIARSQSYATARVSLKYLYGALEMTGQTFELADKNFQAFASALDEEMKGLRQVRVQGDIPGSPDHVIQEHHDPEAESRGGVHTSEFIQG